MATTTAIRSKAGDNSAPDHPKPRTNVDPSLRVGTRKPMTSAWKPPIREPKKVKDWLSPEDFAEIERLGGQKLNPEIRASINRTVDLVAEWGRRGRQTSRSERRN